MRKSLHNEADFEEIIARFRSLEEKCDGKWGRLKCAEMLQHCRMVLQIPLGNVVLPRKNWLIRSIGILTKHEMRIFNNGIPRNMPTFDVLVPHGFGSYDDELKSLFETLYLYKECYSKNLLPSFHQLFGKMSPEDWGFLEYKHLHHHLKQFRV